MSQQHAESTAVKTTELVIAFGLVYLIWGSTYLAIRFAVETLPPFLMAGIRFLVAGTLLYGWMRIRGAKRPTFRHWKSTAIVGGLLLLGGNGGVVWAEQIVPSGITALMIATVPLWMVLLYWMSPGGKRPSLQVWIGVVIGFFGIVLLVNPFASVNSFRVDPVGAAVLCFATISWSIGSIYSRNAPMPPESLLATAMEMLTGGFLLTLAGTVSGEWNHLNLAAASFRSLVSVAYLIVFGSLVAFSAYTWLLKHTTPARVSTYAYVNPVIAVFLGWALAGETVNSRIGVAATVIIFAVVLITTYRDKRASSTK
ncbi:MAG: drug/metabolite exporter YedA [Acidobacteria bacterium]|nr:drug/metabolite exporter YedA [Acidobacteriota bacterium]